MIFLKLQTTSKDRQSSGYYRLTIEQLMRIIPEFDWEGFIINGVFRDVVNITVNKNDSILVTDSEYLKNVAQFYTQLTSSQIK